MITCDLINSSTTQCYGDFFDVAVIFFILSIFLLAFFVVYSIFKD